MMDEQPEAKAEDDGDALDAAVNTMKSGQAPGASRLSDGSGDARLSGGGSGDTR